MFIRFLIAFIFLLSLPAYASAAENREAMDVQPIYPDNQVPTTKGYFDVDVQTGEDLTLHLRLKNNDEEPITVRVEKANAYTSPTGGIYYKEEVNSEDTELLEDAVRLAEYITVEESVTIPANESLDLPVQVSIPEVDGETLLGGIQVTQIEEKKEEETVTSDDEANFTVNTETTYSVAIKLNTSKISEPEFSTGQAGFIAETAQVFLEMVNDAHLIQGEIEGTYSVLDNEGTELFTGEAGPFNMAPKSKIRHPFPWNHETLEDGDYTLVFNGRAGEQEFTAEENFTISNEAVEEYAEIINPSPVVDQNQGIPAWIWICAIIISGAVLFLLGRRKTVSVSKENKE